MAAAPRRVLHDYRHLLIVVGLGLAARIALALVFLPADVLSGGGGDAETYYELSVAARNGHLLAPNMFVGRPPGFPYLSGLVMLAVGRSPWVLVGISVLASVAAGVLAGMLGAMAGFSAKRQLVLAAAVSFDPTMLRFGYTPVADALHAAAVTAALVALLALRRDPSRKAARIALALSAAGAVAVKPSSLFLWALVGVFLLSWRQRAAAAMVAACSIAVIGLWTARNVADSGIPTYSTIGMHALLFYRAGGIETRTRNVSYSDVVLPEFEERLAQRLGLDPPKPYTYYAYPPDKRTYDAVSELAFEVIKAKPVQYVLATPVGFYRLVVGDWRPFERPLAAYYAALYAFALVGWLRMRRRDRSLARLSLAVCAFYATTLLILETAGFGGTRQAAPFLPLVYLMALWPREPVPAQGEPPASRTS